MNGDAVIDVLVLEEEEAKGELPKILSLIWSNFPIIDWHNSRHKLSEIFG
jgi:hypothetical protein